MPIAADVLLAAIECDTLETSLIRGNETSTIAILIDGVVVENVRCLKLERPAARVSHDGRSVEVFPSPGMPDGFSIGCQTHEEAIIIVEALNDRFETSYIDLVEPEVL